MFLGLFSSHLPFIILGAVYFVTFAFASLQRMAGATDEGFVADDPNATTIAISAIQNLETSHPFETSKLVAPGNSPPAVPKVTVFILHQHLFEQWLLPASGPHCGMSFIRPPPPQA